MKKIIFLFPIFFLLIFFSSNNIIAETKTASNTIQEQIVNENSSDNESDLLNNSDINVNKSEEEHKEDNESSSHGSDMTSLLFIIISLIIGAAIRHFLRKSPLPYTGMLFLFGILLGVSNRMGLFEIFHLTSIGESFTWAGHIDPHLILYVFLPTLVFEAAFGMDGHTFKKTVTNAVILAVPGIIIALLLTGALVMLLNIVGIGLNQWTWSIALMFGAVISATDPVAVVSLLKDLGASKKLGTLIEAESLLNDGTAIVFFMVFFLSLTGAAGDNSPIIDFCTVAFGGVFLGLIVGWITISWVRRVFNDPMVEISVIIAFAYLTFFVAEYFLHVSGVLGLVAFGLVMSGVGKTKISPEVEHFLHEFWELAVFIANTIIFIIVGLVIAQRTVFTANDFLILAIVYVGINAVRAIVIIVLFPFMRKTGYGLTVKDSYVLWWGALRGAIGLALALIVAGVDDKYISPEIKNQFLFLTAGIVTLTLLVNATTIKWFVNKLGLTKISPAKAIMIKNAKDYLRQSSENAVERIKLDRFMSHSDWDIVNGYLPEIDSEENLQQTKIEEIAEMRRLILEKEKSSYWHQFQDGLIGATAVSNLTDGISQILDNEGLTSLSDRKDLEELWETPKLLNKLQSTPVLGKFVTNMFFNKLMISYESAQGFVVSQEEALKLTESIRRSIEENDEIGQNNVAIIEDEINENKIHGLTFLRNLRKKYPEIYNALSTRQASRSLLNYERRTVERLQKNGRLNDDEASKMVLNIEIQMKKLMDSTISIKFPEPEDVLRKTEWLKDVDAKLFAKILHHFSSRVFTVGEALMKENEAGDSIYIIVRGTLKVMQGKEVVEILGSGSLVGVQSVLLGRSRTKTVIAESPVTAERIRYIKVLRIVKENEELGIKLWKIAGQKITENLIRKSTPFNTWSEKKLKRWISQGEIVSDKHESILNFNDSIGILIAGRAFVNNDKKEVIDSPAVIENKEIFLDDDTWVFVCAKVV
ncbi:MAG: cation:proton antiporter [Bacteroidetes bacterium]|nr:cation:proton antiporter [Bacteroidota bacterium]